MRKPEEVMEDFLDCWKKKDWQMMVGVTQDTWRFDQKNPEKELENFYMFKELKDFSMKGIKFNKSFNPDVCIDIEIVICYKVINEIKTKKIVGRLIKEIAPYKPHKEGFWGVNPISILRESK